MHDVRYANAARLGKSLQTRGDIHAIAKNIAFVKNDIAKIDPDAVDDPTVNRACAFTLGHRCLDVDGTSHSVLGGTELHQHSVAGGLYDAPAAVSRFQDRSTPPMSFLTYQHVLLILFHKPAIARHIGCEYGGESTVHIAPPISGGWSSPDLAAFQLDRIRTAPTEVNSRCRCATEVIEHNLLQRFRIQLAICDRAQDDPGEAIANALQHRGVGNWLPLQHNRNTLISTRYIIESVSGG